MDKNTAKYTPGAIYNPDNCPPVAVIILNWNGASLLRQYLPSVISNTDPSIGRVIVADNGSTDDSLQVMATEFPTVDVVQFAENYGFAGGYNRAIELCAYPYTVLLNSDVYTPAGWLNPLYQAMVDNKRLGACQPKILSDRNRGQFEYAGASGGFIDKNGYPYCRGRIFDTCENDNGQYDNPIPIFWATGAALMVETTLYLRLGGLDEAFFAHMEEIDLCWRILLDDREIYVIPSSIVYHLGGGSLPAGNPRKTYLNFRNNLLLLYKNLPPRVRGRKIFVRKILDGVAALQFAIKGQWRSALAVWKAHKDYARMKRNYNTTPTRNILDTYPGSQRNILLDYYLRRRKSFSELK